jgi:O-glycosyl hydrolase
VLTTGVWDDQIAFVNPDGSTVIVVGNSAKQPYDFILTVAGRSDGGTIKVTLPAQSINTFVVAP